LYAFLEFLPPWGHYMSAIAMDADWARQALDLEAAGEGLPPTGESDEDHAATPLYYDPLVARLDLIADRVMAVRTATQAAYSQDNKEPYFDPITRPMTAMDRERERRERNALEEVNALIQGEGLFLVIE
jgi:hypothetical protein